MTVPPIDLRAQARSLGTAVADAVAEVLADQQCILGPHVERFERAMAAYAAFMEGWRNRTDPAAKRVQRFRKAAAEAAE